jgi:hypothetical protein
MIENLKQGTLVRCIKPDGYDDLLQPEVGQVVRVGFIAGDHFVGISLSSEETYPSLSRFNWEEI